MGNNTKQIIIGFFPGVWDLVHIGHILALKEAKQHCDILIVGIKKTTIDQPRKNKPIMTLEERKIALEGVRYVDEIVEYETEEELYDMDLTMEVNVRFMGEDHRGQKHHPIKAEVVYITRNHNYSTSEIRRRIAEAERNK